MKICLVTAFPPSHERLNEYGYHLALELQKNPFLSVTVLADQHGGDEDELPGFDVVRCWRPDSLANPVRLMQTIRDIQPDVVWFNLVFSTFGVDPAAAFLGLCVPAMVRAAGYSTHITLHHLMEAVSLDDSGVRFPHLYRTFGWVATHVLLRANSVTVLLPAYRRTLLGKYHRDNVHVRSHGIFSATPQYPDFSQRGNPHRILAFGKWGTYKRVDLLLDAFPEIRKAVPGCKLVIAGENHPTVPGYVEALRERYKDSPDIEIMGYVPEDRIARLFSTASVMVMPYTSAGGSSGVAHQACQFGLPVVCADISDFRDMAEEEGLAIEFFSVGDRHSLATSIADLLSDGERQREMADQNYSAAVRHTMPEVVRQYVRSFDWQLRRRAFQPIWRFRPRRDLAFVPFVAPAWNSTLMSAPIPVAAPMELARTLGLAETAEAIPAPACPTVPAPASRLYSLEPRTARRPRRLRPAEMLSQQGKAA